MTVDKCEPEECEKNASWAMLKIAELRREIEVNNACSREQREAFQVYKRETQEEIERLKGELNARQRSFSEAQKEAVANAQEADQLREWLADLTEILCGERPIGVMPETTKDAAIKLKLERAKELARARNYGLEKAASRAAERGFPHVAASILSLMEPV